MNLRTRGRCSGNFPDISLQGMSTATGTLGEGNLGTATGTLGEGNLGTATGTLGEGNLGTLQAMPQLKYSLHIAFNRQSLTPGTYKALSWDYSWTKKVSSCLPCATIQNDFQVSHPRCVV